MSENQQMSYGAFVDMASNLVYSLTDRLNENQVDYLIRDTEEGIQEPKLFMRYLLFTLVDNKLPISPAERDSVIVLMRHRKMDLAKVDQFNIVEQANATNSIIDGSNERLAHPDFVELSRTLVLGLHGRLDDEYRESVLRSDIDENIPEPRRFVDYLIGRLLVDRIQITPTERDIIVRLMADQKVNLTPVTKFNIAEQ